MQTRPTKMILVLEKMLSSKRLRMLNLFSLSGRRPRDDLISVCSSVLPRRKCRVLKRYLI